MNSLFFPSALAAATLIAAPLARAQLVINEVDADQTGTDTAEFIELYDGGTGNTALDGYVVVLFNGNDDQSYSAYYLGGFSTDGSGYFVLGSSGVNGAEITLGSNAIQNGPDAVALYTGYESDFPNDTPITTLDLVDVVVYGSNDPDDTGLLTGFGQTTQFNDTATESVSRVPDGSGDFSSQAPSPGATNGVPDTTAPTIDTLEPAGGAIDVPVYADLSITFDEAVQAGTGNITLHLQSDGSLVETYDVTADVDITGSTLTIDTFFDLATSTGYYLLIPAGAVQDSATNPFAGITDPTGWSFTTAAPDETGPIITELSPANDASDVTPSAKLVITFDEPVQLGIVAELTIKLLSNDDLVETVDLFSNSSFPNGGFSGTELTVNPDTLLAYSTAYYVEIATGAVEDLFGNPFAGISGNSTWNFTTAAAPPPAAVVISQYYEGSSFNKYLEIQNVSGGPITLDNYILAGFNNANREIWKSADQTAASANNSLDLSGITLQDGEYYLIANPDAADPGYAATGANVASAVAGFNGDDSVVLYHDADIDGTLAIGEIVDAIACTDADEGQNTSFYRLNNDMGYDLGDGSSILDYEDAITGSGPWLQVDTSTVDSTSDQNDPIALQYQAPALAPVLDTFVLAGDAATTAIPGVTLDVTTSGGNADEFQASEAPDFSGASWLPYDTKLSFQLSAGAGTKTVYLKLRNANGESGVLSDSIDLGSFTYLGELIFTQYHEGDVGNNKYVEITNTSASPIDLADHYIARFTNATAEDWKVTGTAQPTLIPLAGAGTLAAGETMVVANNSATTPIDASTVTPPDLASGSLNHNGNDSLVLYLDADQGGTVDPSELLDALSFTDSGAEGTNTGFVRIAAGQGFDFNAATSILDSGATWQQVDIATVEAAASNENEFLGTYPGGPPPSSDFDAWLTDNGYTSTGFDNDDDLDGDSNAEEWYFFNTSPNAPSGNGSAISATNSTAPGSFTFTHRRPTSRAGVTENYQWSTKLDGSWNPSDGTVTITPGATTPDGAGYELVEVSVSVTPATTKMVFVRLELTETP